MFSTRSDLSESLLDHYSGIDKWGWDPFVAAKLTNGRPLHYAIIELWRKHNLSHRFQIPPSTLISFADAIEESYQVHGAPYHNNIHACDVLVTIHQLLLQTQLAHWFSDLELFSMLFAAAIHDLEHTGTNNQFHITSKSELALLYNDQSVLENHHISTAFRIMRDSDKNITQNLDDNQWREFRSNVIAMVLSTDMANHFDKIETIKGAIRMPKEYWKNVLQDESTEYPRTMEKIRIMELLLHSSDLSNCVKPWAIHSKSASLLLEEFFRQGDLEKSMGCPVSPLCDRRTTNIPQSQIGFITYIIEPTYAILTEASHFVATEFLPVVLEEEKSMARISTEKKFKALRSADVKQDEILGHIETFSKVWMDHLTANKTRWMDFDINDFDFNLNDAPSEPIRRNNSASSTSSAHIIHN